MVEIKYRHLNNHVMKNLMGELMRVRYRRGVDENKGANNKNEKKTIEEGRGLWLMVGMAY